MRFAGTFGASDAELTEALKSAPDANLGGGVFKFRIARAGEGTSGGARAIVAMKAGDRAVMMFGFEKKDQANIRQDELVAFRKAAKEYLALDSGQIQTALASGALVELNRMPQKTVTKKSRNVTTKTLDKGRVWQSNR